MDGNGRWAKQRGLKRTDGHARGEDALFDVIEGAIEMGIPYLSVYAFSTENWKRSPEEVRWLMGFNRDVIHRRRDLAARDLTAPLRRIPDRRTAVRAITGRERHTVTRLALNGREIVILRAIELEPQTNRRSVRGVRHPLPYLHRNS